MKIFHAAKYVSAGQYSFTQSRCGETITPDDIAETDDSMNCARCRELGLQTVKIEIQQDITVRVTYTDEINVGGNEFYLEAVRNGEGVGEYLIPMDLIMGDRNPSAKLIAAEILGSAFDTWDGQEPMQPTIRLVEEPSQEAK